MYQRGARVVLIEKSSFLRQVAAEVASNNSATVQILDVVPSELNAAVLVHESADLTLLSLATALSELPDGALKGDAVMIPAQSQVHCCAIELRTPAQCDFNLEHFDRFRTAPPPDTRPGYSLLRLGKHEHRLLSESFEAVCIGLQGDGARADEIVKLKATGTGRVNAVVLWQHFVFAGGAVWSNRPSEGSSLKQAIIYLDRSLDVEPGASIALQMGQAGECISVKLRTQRAIKPLVVPARAPGVCFAISAYHFGMIVDRERNRQYQAAVQRAVKRKQAALGRPCVAVDIGTGTGLLAMVAAAAGASPVVAFEMVPQLVECARSVVRQNGFGEQIQLHGIASTQASLPEHDRADVVVSEILDDLLVGEGVFETIAHARIHLAKPDAIFVPARAVLYVQMIFLEPFQVDGVTLNAVNEAFQPHFEWTPSWADSSDYKPRSEPTPILQVDLSNPPPGENMQQVSLRASTRGVCNCLMYWWDVVLDDESSSWTGPDSVQNTWKPILTYTPSAAINVGDQMPICIRLTEAHLDVMPLWKDEHTGPIGLPRYV